MSSSALSHHTAQSSGGDRRQLPFDRMAMEALLTVFPGCIFSYPVAGSILGRLVVLLRFQKMGDWWRGSDGRWASRLLRAVGLLKKVTVSFLFDLQVFFISRTMKPCSLWSALSLVYILRRRLSRCFW